MQDKSTSVTLLAYLASTEPCSVDQALVSLSVSSPSVKWCHSIALPNKGAGKINTLKTDIWYPLWGARHASYVMQVTSLESTYLASCSRTVFPTLCWRKTLSHRHSLCVSSFRWSTSINGRNAWQSMECLHQTHSIDDAASMAAA